MPSAGLAHPHGDAAGTASSTARGPSQRTDTAPLPQAVTRSPALHFWKSPISSRAKPELSPRPPSARVAVDNPVSEGKLHVNHNRPDGLGTVSGDGVRSLAGDDRPYARSRHPRPDSGCRGRLLRVVLRRPSTRNRTGLPSLAATLLQALCLAELLRVNCSRWPSRQ